MPLRLSARRWSPISGTLLALAALSSGCQAANVRSMYASDFTCPDERISVEEIAPERFRAEGCGEVVYQCLGSTCFPESVPEDPRDDDEALVAASRRASAAAREEAGQAHLQKKGSKVSVALDVRLDDRALLKLRAAPQQHGEVVQLKLVRIEAEQELDGCEILPLVNGQRLPALKARFNRQRSLSSLLSNVPRDVVQELGGARQFALRACDLRWSLRPEQVAEVRRFVDLYQEELAWEGTPSKSGTRGLLAPFGGWPAWKPEGAAPAAAAGATLEPPALFKLLSPSVFQIEALLANGSSQGSAVAVSKSELLTNCHVVQGARKIIAKQGKKEYVASIARSDAATDRCVLSVPDPVLTPVRGVRSYANLEVGEPLFTLGSPNGLELTLSNGILSGLREERGRKFVQTTAPISPGSSGGGLFDARGNVVGITTLVLIGRERLNQSLNFALPADAFWAP